jgi:hypothetical protein
MTSNPHFLEHIYGNEILSQTFMNFIESIFLISICLNFYIYKKTPPIFSGDIYCLNHALIPGNGLDIHFGLPTGR